MNYIIIYLIAAYVLLITDYKKKGGLLRTLPLIGTRKDNCEELTYWFTPIWFPLFVCGGALWVVCLVIMGIIITMILLTRLVVSGNVAPS
ncbi:hypothetical protein KBC03_07925 [Patescibacteria group bacterium]|nr:hypothetical protein [Patescibacteria group bacterium]